MDVHNHPIYRAIRAGFLEVRQLGLLIAVVREPGLSTRDYAARLAVSKPVITRASDALCLMELTENAKAPNDKRLRLLQPTARGRTLITEIVGPEVLDAHTQPRGEPARNGQGLGGQVRV